MRAILLGVLLLSASAIASEDVWTAKSDDMQFTGEQQKGILFERVRIKVNGETAIKGRLSLQDRAGTFKGSHGGRRIVADCITVNGFSLLLDCKVYSDSVSGTQIAQLRF